MSNTVQTTKDDIESRLRAALSRLLKNEPFYGFMLLDMKRIRDPKFPAPMGTTISDARFLLYYNPELCQNFTTKELAAIYKHEVLHHIMNHIVRSRNFPAIVMTSNGPVSVYNIAGDMSINQYIPSLPVGCVTLPKGWPAEKAADVYYDMLLKQAKDRQNACPKHGNGQGQKESSKGKGADGDKGKGGDKDGKGKGKGKKDKDKAEQDGQSGGEGGEGQADDHEHGNGPPCTCGHDQFWEQYKDLAHDHWKKAKEASPQIVEEVIRQKAQRAKEHAQATNSWGNLPNGVQKLVEELLKPEIPWHRYVRNWRGHVIQQGQQLTRNRPNRRYGYEMPGRLPDFKGRAVALIDTSGSVSPELQRRLLSEAAGANEEIQIVIAEVDACIQRVYLAGDLTKGGLEVKGNGGTVFDELLDILCYGKFRKDFPRPWRSLLANLNGAIFLTDGYVSIKHPQPKMPFLWVYPEAHGEPVTWGTKIIMRPEDLKK